MIANSRLILSVLLALALAPGAAAAQTSAPTDAAARPRNVILMIPDGCGPAAVGLGRMVAGRPLSMDSILVGAVQTRSASSRVTDSAAGGTALASGVKTTNGVAGLDPQGRPVGTLIEAAAARGMAVGFVTTASVTDATPAAFLSHVANRHAEDAIAVQVIEHRLDVLFGGGLTRVLPEGAGGGRRDGRDLLAEARRHGVRVVTSRAELATAIETPLLGLFANGDLDLEVDRDSTRQPSLAELTERALALLARRGNGFLLVVEGARIDGAAHDNDPAAVGREVLAYDRALAAALAFARREPGTLLVASADHETGGLGLGLRIGGESAHDMAPESLLTERTSVWRMADSVLAGADPVAVAGQGTGLRGLTAQEQAELRAAAGSRDRMIGTVGDLASRRSGVGWSTGWHTAVDVGLYAWGPGRERFIGLHENTDVARLIAELLGLDLDAETARLRGAAGTR
jgi:alkaline phosphatase